MADHDAVAPGEREQVNYLIHLLYVRQVKRLARLVSHAMAPPPFPHRAPFRAAPCGYRVSRRRVFGSSRGRVAQHSARAKA
jgi:hypothetical protein